MKLIHAADFHLDSAFAGLPPEKARRRRQESRALPGKLAELAIEEKADLVLLAGDLFDSDWVYPETLEALTIALAKIPCPVFIAPGNHDPYTARSPYAAKPWPGNVHIFHASDLEAVEVPELNCVVHGAAFTGPSRRDEALSGFIAPEDGNIHLLCLHGEVGGSDSSYGPIAREYIAASGLAYLALGHVHQCSTLQREGGSVWAYPGCIEGRGFDELGDKGCLVVVLDGEGVRGRFQPLGGRRYRVLHADVTGRSAREALEETLTSAESEDVCRVIFTGEAERIDLPQLEAAYGGRVFQLQLKDQTTLPQDIWARAGEDSLRGAFLGELRLRYAQAQDDGEREKITLAVRMGLAALDGRDA